MLYKLYDEGDSLEDVLNEMSFEEYMMVQAIDEATIIDLIEDEPMLTASEVRYIMGIKGDRFQINPDEL